MNNSPKNSILKKINFEIITSRHKWRQCLNEIELYDFYHTYNYHILEKGKNNQPVLLKYTEGSSVIALPLIIRKIEKSEHFDATSVYGYSGPIAKNISKGFNNNLFLEKLQLFFEENKDPTKRAPPNTMVLTIAAITNNKNRG